MKNLRAALVSFSSQFGQPGENLQRIVDWVKLAADEKANLVCFPEVALQGYFTDTRLMHEQAEDFDGPSCQRLTEVAASTGVVISLGMALRVDRQVFNAQVFVGPDGVLGYAPKVHLGEEGEGEHLCFNAGEHWPVIDIGLAKVGTLICWDAEFPEAARCLALDGAEVLLMSFATGRCDSCGRPQSPDKWASQVLAWAPARAYDNRVFALGVNHAGDVTDEQGLEQADWVGPDRVHRWPGYSFAVDPAGQLMAESARDHNRERILIVDLDPAVREHWRSGSGDFLAVRRPQTFGRLLASDSSS